ncbi:SrpA-related protein [hydrothermal vent metagenome]|uniref:SrpA-related protein n=1 Tax=hydrothermal vent metagenome TaxID=652676 RepID=A0A3B0X335_9ZZZZ
MIVNSSQNIQSGNPLNTSATSRINAPLRASNTNPAEDDKAAERAAEKVQLQQDTAMLSKLRARDREVRAHEGAHVAAGGSLVRGGPSYTLQKGPDGRSYAIGGEVQIDASPVDGDPNATLVKAGRIRSAALAPAEPSPQDRRVASNASQLASRARVDIAVLRREENKIEDNEQAVNDASAVSETDTENGVGNVAEEQNQNTVGATPTDTQSNLQTNDEPVAAISAFMTTAKTQTPPILSQFA